MIQIQQQHVEIALYILAMTLATYGLWERFPKGGHPGQQLALAGALLTLFLTFFLTSIRIDQAREDIALLHRDIDAAILDEQLRALKNAKDLTDAVLYSMLERVSNQLTAINANGEANLYEDEAVRFLGEVVAAEMEQNPTGLRIMAISVDPAEFNRTVTFRGYEGALADAVKKGARVERAYVLPSETWRKATAVKTWLSSEPWIVADRLSELGLDAVRRHYRSGIHCVLVPQSILGQANARDLDLILVSRASTVILAANRVGQDELHIVRRQSALTKDWRRTVEDVLADPEALTLPDFKPQPRRPIEDR